MVLQYRYWNDRTSYTFYLWWGNI